MIKMERCGEDDKKWEEAKRVMKMGRGGNDGG